MCFLVVVRVWNFLIVWCWVVLVVVGSGCWYSVMGCVVGLGLMLFGWFGYGLVWGWLVIVYFVVIVLVWVWILDCVRYYVCFVFVMWCWVCWCLLWYFVGCVLVVFGDVLVGLVIGFLLVFCCCYGLCSVWLSFWGCVGCWYLVFELVVVGLCWLCLFIFNEFCCLVLLCYLCVFGLVSWFS